MRRGLPWLVFAASYGLALRHLHPAFALDDSPETIAAAAALGVQHMPGYPLVTLLGRLAAGVPVGAVTFRVNLLAAVLMAACAARLAVLTSLVFPTAAGAAAGALAGLWFAASGLAQDTALSAKGAVYALNLLLTVELVRGLLHGTHRAALGLLAGAGLAHHWMSFVCWLPGLLFIRRSWTRRGLGIGAGMAVLGLSAYLQLPLSAEREPAWGDPATARGLTDILLRRDLLPHSTARPRATVLLQLGWNALEPLRTGGLPFMLLGLAGMAALARHRPRAAGLIGLGAGVTLFAVAVGTNPVHHRTGELVLWFTEPFLLPWLGLFTLAVGAGILLVLRALPVPARPWGWLAGLALPLLALAHAPGVHDHSANYLGWDFGCNSLADVHQPAILLAEADFTAWPAMAMLDALRPVPRVALIMTNPFLERAWGWRRLRRRFPHLRWVEASDAKTGMRVDLLVDGAQAWRPVSHLGLSGYPPLAARQRPIGLTGPVQPAGAPAAAVTETESARWFSRARLRGLFGASPPKDPLTRVTLDQYILARCRPAEAARLAGRIPEAVAGFRTASRFPGLFIRAQALRNLGLGSALAGRDADAERAFAEAAHLRPGDASLWANAGIACSRQGKTAEARRWLTAALRVDPHHAAALAALRALP